MASLPERPTDIDKLDATKAIQPGEEHAPPESGKFASYMNAETPPAMQPSQNPNQISPMQLSQQGRPSAGTPPTLGDIRSQMQATAGSLGDIKTQLHTKGLKLSQSQKYLLRSKLSSANEHIRDVAQRTGVDTGAPINLREKKNPIAKFLELVSDGQNQLNAAIAEANKLDASGQSVTPAKLLLIQAKLQKASQELDYTSVLLGKAVDIIKTLFNVQI